MSGAPNKNAAPRRGPMNGSPGMMRGEKARDFKGAASKLIKYLAGYRIVVLIVLLLAAASTVFMIVGPKILARATDEIANGIIRLMSGTGGFDFEKIGSILLFLVGLYVLSALLSYVQGFIMTDITIKLTCNLRRDIDEKIHKLPFSYFDKTTHGEVLSRITNDVDTMSQTLNQSLAQIISSVTAVVGIAAMMLTISWQMTLVTMCILPLSALFVMFIVGKSQKHFERQQEYLGHVNGHVEEMFANHTVVKAFNGEAASLEAFEEYNGHLYDSAWKSGFLSGMMMPIINFIGNLAYVAVCIMGGYFAINGRMSIGDIQAFIQYIRSFIHPIAQIANISNILQQTAAAAERVFEFLAEEEEPPEVPGAINAAKDGTRRIGFENVVFGYNADKTIIHNFSAAIEPGQRVAIVGPTGAGKTTIVKLLMRFYDLNDGEITIDGKDIKLYKRNSLRSLFGMVLQDTWLYNGTIADNIRYGKPDATDTEVVHAAEAAQADHFIRTLPDGYNLVLNEEADNISQGQKQLLTIARALLADPEILILDEATSSVDTRTEVLIQKAMDNLMKGRTSFIIAHRLSTIRDADMILVMRDGDIVEQGKHTELLAREGFYADLYNSQFDNAG